MLLWGKMRKGRGENRIWWVSSDDIIALVCLTALGDVYFSKVIDSPCMPEAECTIQLCTGGIADGDE